MQPSTNNRSGPASSGTDEPSSTIDGRIGALIADRYRVERLIGRGGMASVYEASDTALPRRVALKIFRPELTDGDEMRRHDGEVGMLAALNHPGLVTLHDAVTDERGAAVLVLELVDGTDLREVMDARTLSRREVALIGAIVADALAYSHQKGIVHRDVKPANILVPTSDDEHTGAWAKLADFGIARLVDETRVTAIGSVIGTAQYLSPEQALGAEVGPSSDVYSLGLVLIEALGGERPFPGTGVESVAARLARDPEAPEGLSAPWVELLQGMTAREPDDRVRAGDAGRALRALAEDSPEATVAPAVGTASADADTELLTPAGTEVLAPTAILPVSRDSAASETAATEVLGGTRASAASPTPTASVASPQTSLRRNTVMVALIALVIIAISGLALGLAFSAATAPSTVDVEAPDYPAVEGPVGDHLDELQRSVAP